MILKSIIYKKMEYYVKEANDINKDFRRRLNTPEFKALGDEKWLAYYQKKNKKFATTFPIALRYMIQLGQYKEKAFRKFLKRLQHKKYKNEREYCERQADYVKYLYIEVTDHHDERMAKEVWTKTFDTLWKETIVFKEAEERIKKKNEKNEKTNALERRNELKELLKNPQSLNMI